MFICICEYRSFRGQQQCHTKKSQKIHYKNNLEAWKLVLDIIKPGI